MSQCVSTRTNEQDREMIIISEDIYQAGVMDAINEIENVPLAQACFTRFKRYKQTTGKRIYNGIDANNPEEIKQVKDERKDMAADFEENIQGEYDPENLGFATFSSLEEAKIVLRSPLALMTMSKATRNMTFSNKGLLDSLNDQRECFREDLSSLAGPSTPEIEENIRSLGEYMQEMFRNFKKAEPRTWNVPTAENFFMSREEHGKRREERVRSRSH